MLRKNWFIALCSCKSSAAMLQYWNELERRFISHKEIEEFMPSKWKIYMYIYICKYMYKYISMYHRNDSVYEGLNMPDLLKDDILYRYKLLCPIYIYIYIYIRYNPYTILTVFVAWCYLINASWLIWSVSPIIQCASLALAQDWFPVPMGYPEEYGLTRSGSN